MLKKIPTAALKPGMYLARIEGSYLQHPFWRRSFRLANQAEVQVLHDSGIAEVWIDLTRGDDVAAPPVAAAPSPAAAPPAAVAPPPPSPPPSPLPSLPTTPRAVRTGSARDRAMALREHAKSAVTSLFADVRLGKVIDGGACLPLVDQISESLHEDPGTFLGLVRLRRQDEYTYLHSVAVCALMVGLAREMGQGEDAVRQAGLAGLLHDLGKALMPLDLLNKPGRLTEAEFAVMRGHPERGWRMLRESPHIDEGAVDVCLHHHEKVDGTGYPHGLAGEQISLLARMGAVCDVYDAITSNRPYKTAWDPGESLRRMAQWKGHFDPTVFKAFVRTVGIYPVGTLVRLESQRLAVVCEQRPTALQRPLVKVFYSLRSNLRIPPVMLELDRPGCRDAIVGVEAAEGWGFQDLDRLWSDAA
jgi:putative nucleotidyltransferase with HDIG domain